MLIRRITELKFPDEIKRNRGRACRRRDKSISNKLKQAHTPWHKR